MYTPRLKRQGRVKGLFGGFKQGMEFWMLQEPGHNQKGNTSQVELNFSAKAGHLCNADPLGTGMEDQIRGCRLPSILPDMPKIPKYPKHTTPNSRAILKLKYYCNPGRSPETHALRPKTSTTKRPKLWTRP